MNKNSLIENRALNVILTDFSPNWGGQQYRLLRLPLSTVPGSSGPPRGI
jgi:hypothetical protein